jgi:DNA-binding transcriptional regulator YdaS (Cro superfamily)
MQTLLRQQVLHRALELAGGRTLLCAMLGVSQSRLDGWLEGRLEIPDETFDAAVAMVLMDDLARAAQDRRAEPRECEPLLQMGGRLSRS